VRSTESSVDSRELAWATKKIKLEVALLIDSSARDFRFELILRETDMYISVLTIELICLDHFDF
jgi:hypothetical protein